MGQRIGAALLLLLASLWQPLGPAHAAEAKTFQFRLPAQPETLDWNVAHTSVEAYLLLNLMEGLVSFDSKLKLTPALAESWTISGDQKTYTFKLRRGVKWSDGVPLKAQHFIDSWKRLLSPSTAAPNAYMLFGIQGARDFNEGRLTDFSKVGAIAKDDGTLEVHLAQAANHWIDVLSYWVTFPIRIDLIDSLGPSWTEPGKMVTVGPFVYTSLEPSSKIVLSKNPNYYGSSGNVGQAVGLIITDDTEAVKLYELGKLDFLSGATGSQLLQTSARSDLKTFPFLKVNYLGFMVQKYPLQDQHLRRAISMSVDKAKIVKVLGGGQKVAASFIPPGLEGYSAAAGLPYDPARAKAEFKLALRSGLEPLKLEILVNSWEKERTVAEQIQSDLKKNLGIELTVRPMPNQAFRAQLELRNYPLFLKIWYADFPDPDNFLSHFSSSSGINHTGWKDLAYDSNLAKARSLPKASDRLEIYRQTQKSLLDEQSVIVPLYYEPLSALIKPYVKNLELNPLNDLFLKNVRIEK